MKVLFATDVILDVLLAREPDADAAARVFALVDNGKLEGSMCATSVAALYALALDSVGRRRARRRLHELLDFLEVAPVDDSVIEKAVDSPIPDFEDALLHEAAVASGANGIVTRDRKAFAKATLPIFTPAELLAAVVAASG